MTDEDENDDDDAGARGDVRATDVCGGPTER